MLTPSQDLHAQLKTQSCETLFLTTEVRKYSSLASLRAILEAEEPYVGFFHEIISTKGRTILKIGYLHAKHPETLKAIGEAVSKGHIDKIELGAVVGGKMPKWLLRTIEQNPPEHRLVISGTFSFRVIFDQIQQMRRESAIDLGFETQQSTWRIWNQHEEAELQRALVFLASQSTSPDIFKTMITNRGMAEFRFYYDSGARPSIVWTKIDD